uniref:CSON008810 protein n=1 Tax=Culicoides sonorensis TaxID=179676 RepID=A0A336LDM6_CULSO
MNNKSPNTSGPGTTSTPINTATFRISKSASGSALLNNKPSVQVSSNPNPSPILQHNSRNQPSPSSQHSFNKYVHNNNSSSKGSSINNLNQVSGHSRRSSLSNNLSKQYFGGSSQNLTRSSTTNLTKANRNSFHIKPQNYELSRSSTTNLTKDHHGHQKHHGSHANLRRGSTDDLPGIYGRSRKNSTSSRQNMSRTSSNTNLAKQNRHHGSSNNIPRANIGKSSPPYEMQRQISLQHQPKTTTSNATRDHHQFFHSRPHTAACDTTDQKQFEWPKSLSSLERRPKDEPLPSDMEVMLSDVENLR